MVMLFVYLAIAIGVSFLCSLLEAAILSIPRAYVAVLVDEDRKAGHRLAHLKDNIDRPLAAILTLNTFAHTLGAAGVGAQAAAIWGEAWVGVVSFVVTILVLVLSEIIPKTLGAVHAKRLAGFTAAWCTLLIKLLAPAVAACNALSRSLAPKESEATVSRDELRVVAGLAQEEGTLDQTEASIIRNMIALREIAVNDVMTPRTVVTMVRADQTIADAARDSAARFSRLPVIGDSPDDVRGVIHRRDLIDALSRDEDDRPVAELARPLHAVPRLAKLPVVLRTFIERREHLFLVVDEFGGTAGVITLEDIIETIIGQEIVDETDETVDMRELAARLVKAYRSTHPVQPTADNEG